MNKKIPTPLAILIIFLVIAVIIGISLWLCPKEETENVACTQEAKLCPDGSYVSRIGPNCEFAECPATNTDETANWQTYRSEEFGLEMKYPIGLNIKEVINGEEICFTGFSLESPEDITCDFCFYLYPSEGKKPCVENTETGISIGETTAKKENCCCPEPVDCPGNIMYHFGPNRDNRCIDLWMVTMKHTTSPEGYSGGIVGIIVPKCENIFNQMLSTFKFLQ